MLGCNLPSKSASLVTQAKGTPRDPERGLERVSADSSKDVKTANNPGLKHYTDVQSAARFPVNRGEFLCTGIPRRHPGGGLRDPPRARSEI